MLTALLLFQDPFADADEDTGGDQQTNKGEYIHIRIQRTFPQIAYPRFSFAVQLPFLQSAHVQAAIMCNNMLTTRVV